MKDFINSFKAHLYDRTTSPLLGGFIFYWIVFNYKLIMVIFDSDIKIEEKFELIKSIYPQAKFTVWNGFDIYYQALLSNALLIPLLITLIYILLLPFISNKIHKFWLKHQDNLKMISNNQLHTDQEYSELREDFTKLQLSFNETFKSKNIESTELQNKIIEKDNTISENEKIILNYKKRENKKREEYKSEFEVEFDSKYEHRKFMYNSYLSLLEPTNSVLKTLSIDEKIILFTIYKHKDKKIWNVLTANPYTTVEAGKKLLEKGLIENIKPEHYKLSKEGEKIFI